MEIKFCFTNWGLLFKQMFPFLLESESIPNIGSVIAKELVILEIVLDSNSDEEGTSSNIDAEVPAS